MNAKSLLFLLLVAAILPVATEAGVLALSRGPLELDIAPRNDGDEIVEATTEKLGKGVYAVRLAVRDEDDNFLGLWLSQPIKSPGGALKVRMAASDLLPGKPPLVFLSIKSRDARGTRNVIYYLLRLKKAGLTRVCRAPSVGAWKKARNVQVQLSPKLLTVAYGKRRLRYRWTSSHDRFRLRTPIKGSVDAPTLEDSDPSKKATKIVAVSTVDQFIAALGSNRTIALAPGTYVLSSAERVRRGPVSWTKAYDGHELHLEKLVNCTILGTGNEPSHIVTRPRYANVIHFEACKGITMKNLVIGHEPEQGGCTGGVLVFRRSDKIVFDGVTLFGCGVEGLTLEKVTNLHFRNSVIRDCTWSAMSAERCSRLVFDDSRISRCEGGSVINLRNCDGVAYRNCTFTDNSAPRGDLFNIRNVKNISVLEPTLSRNKVRRLANDAALRDILESRM